ncbi:MAG TPA: hypothetical protein VNZ85_13390, partial [Caulobacter sp.]|nr:hypothetical protein [Caulobacter sp.]
MNGARQEWFIVFRRCNIWRNLRNTGVLRNRTLRVHLLMRRFSFIQPRRDLPRLLTAARNELGAVAALLVLAGGALAFLELS